MQGITRMGAACLVAAALAPAVAQEANDPQALLKEAAALRQERYRLEREVRSKLYSQLQQIREQLNKEADLGNLRALIQRTQSAYEEKLKTDPTIVAASKAKEAAAAAAAAAEAEAVTNDPTMAKLQEEQQAAEAAEEQAEFQQRLARFMLNEIRRRITDIPEVRARRDAADQADRALDDLCRRNPKVVAAKEVMRKAERAYYVVMKALPEYKAMVEARKAYEAKVKAVPEYAHMLRAKYAYEQSLQADEATRAAIAARDEARKTYEEEMELALAADGAAAEHIQKLKQAEAAEEAARKKRYEIREKLRDAERALRAQHPKVLEARKAYEAADEAYDKAVSQQAAKDKEALERLQEEVKEKVRQKLASDPKAQLIQEQLNKIDQKIQEIRHRYHELERKARELKSG